MSTWFSWNRLHSHSYTLLFVFSDPTASPSQISHQNLRVKNKLQLAPLSKPVFCCFLVFSPCSLLQHIRESLHAKQEHLVLQKRLFHSFYHCFFWTVWSTWRRGGISREPTSREIRCSFTWESAAHVLSRLFTLSVLFKSITRDRCPPLGLGTNSPIIKRKGGSTFTPLFSVQLWKQCKNCVNKYLSFLQLWQTTCIPCSDILLIHSDK